MMEMVLTLINVQHISLSPHHMEGIEERRKELMKGGKKPLMFTPFNNYYNQPNYYYWDKSFVYVALGYLAD